MFKHHVLATIRLLPTPTSPKEVDFLYRLFQTLGNMELFRIGRDRSGASMYEPVIRVMYSPLRGSLLRSPAQNDVAQTLAEYQDIARIVARKKELVSTLDLLIAIPRFLYLENDKEFWLGRLEVYFKHSLPVDALQYDGQYAIKSARKDDVFHTVLPKGNVDNAMLRSKARFNLQKYHKFVLVHVRDYDRIDLRKRKAVGILERINEWRI